MNEIQTPSLLVSMPNLNDPFFQKSVIMLCDYTPETAFGMVINRPSSLQIRDILVDKDAFSGEMDDPILVGGPVQPELLWAIHTPDFSDETTTRVDPTVYMSSVQEVLRSVSSGVGPTKYHLGSGYAGWGPGQLDGEISDGAWWVAPLSADLVLNMPFEDRWTSVLAEIGIDPLTTSFFTTGEA
ncbi:MAG: YqgE/AlgH family protein [Acidobacteriota bacterium]|nr:YqgE/AlgH family protein [Acidobacteriota bacterium]